MTGPELSAFFLTYWPDMLAFITGVMGVALTIKQNIWCWPFALVSVIISIVVFFRQKLFGDMSLNIFYFVAGVYGWVYWNRNKNKPFRVTFTGRKNYPWLIMATAAQAGLYYFILVKSGGDKPLFDALLTAASVTTTYMMTKKWFENWALWVMINGAYIVLYAIKEMWWYAALYFVFAVMAAAGWFKWRKLVSIK